MGKHREPTKWFAGRIEMGKHMVYTCDRCHAESKAPMKGVALPTGKGNEPQRWDLCPVCVKELETLLKDQEGQCRAFVAGVTLPPEANLSTPDPFQQARYAQQAHAGMGQMGQNPFAQAPNSYFFGQKPGSF